MKFKIGIFGSAKEANALQYSDKLEILGQQIAANEGIVVTGACPGVPHAVAKAAAEGDCPVIGVSPARNMQEHVEVFHMQTDEFYQLIFTGFGSKGRNIISIRSCDAAIFINGQIGSLHEWCTAHDEASDKYVIGVLEGTGGIADIVRDLKAKIDKPSKAHIVYDKDPENLVSQIFTILKAG